MLKCTAVVLALILSFGLTSRGAFASQIPVKKSTTTSSSNSGTVRECQSNHFFGKQLQTTQELEIYVVLERHLLLERRISQTGNIKFNEPLILDYYLPAGKTIYDQQTEIVKITTEKLQRAVDAFRYDHPEMYWITGSTLFSDIAISTNKMGSVAVDGVVLDFEPLKSDYENDDKKIAEISDKIVKKANKYSTDYEKLKVVHDMLAEQIEYDDRNIIPLRAFQITGGLVDGSGVCETYAKSFKYIAEKLGYEVILVAGNATHKGQRMPHMWNYVKVGSKWYAIDVTWDDQKILVSDYFLVGKQTEAMHFGKLKFEDTHTEEYVFHTIGYDPFTYPELSKVALSTPY